jgi:TetR/AcrR family transcriptional regulator, repressor for lfrA
MGSQDQPDSGVRARTRFAILEAARKMLPDNPSASILEIADSAGVGRSTIHRYFPDRSTLIKQLALHIYRLSDEAVSRAAPSTGRPVEALRRVIEEQFDLGPALDYIYNEQVYKKDPKLFRDVTVADELVADVLERAANDSRNLPPQWRERVFWTLLRLGSEVTRDGHAKHEVIDAIMTTLLKGLASTGEKPSSAMD